MKRLVEFPLDQGGSILVEVDVPSGGTTVRGVGADRGALVDKADRTFEQATAALIPAARSLIVQLRSIENPPDEIGIEFGVQLTAQTGAIIASIGAEANFRMHMTWRSQAAKP